MVSMNRLNTEKRCQVVRALVEGCSVRMTGVSKNTVTKLLVDIGEACSAYQDKVLRNLTCRRLQLDEIWSFCYSKAKNVPVDKQGQFGVGDVWTWVAIDADTKLVPSWLVGTRDGDCVAAFVNDLSRRLTHRVQITSDGLKSYLDAVEGAFGGNVDFAQLVKLYGKDESPKDSRYSPPKCVGCRPKNVTGYPDSSHISTSFVERQNLTIRMHMWRFTRLTNAFSKKVENHACAIALHFMHYNFARIHQTIKSTPAMLAGVADHLWSIEEIVGLLETKERISN